MILWANLRYALECLVLALEHLGSAVQQLADRWLTNLDPGDPDWFSLDYEEAGEVPPGPDGELCTGYVSTEPTEDRVFITPSSTLLPAALANDAERLLP